MKILASSVILGAAALLGLVHDVCAGFKILCLTNVIERIDPIISPGAVSQHVHVVSGANTINFTAAGSDYSTLLQALCTSCVVKQDKSLYWAPALYYRAQNGSYIRVLINGDTTDNSFGNGGQRGGITIYYKDEVATGQNISAFPAGFRMVAGNPFLRSGTPYNSSYGNITSFECEGATGSSEKPVTYPGLPTKPCAGGMRAQIHFPHCWNGSADSTNHYSHMAYPLDAVEGTQCPSTHPYVVPHLFYEIVFNVPSFTTTFPWYNSSQPFVLAQGDPTGYGLHADFVNGWDTSLLYNAINKCNRGDAGDAKNCVGFTLATDGTNEQLACEVAPQVNEDVNGPMSLLPGCNPIQPGPASATVASCTPARTGSIAPAKTYYTNQTSTYGYSYIGCGNDTNGNNQFSIYDNGHQTSMTVPMCISFCKNQANYKYAAINGNGVCYCGNTGAHPNFFPQPGILGNCDQPCRGDSSQYCGGFYAMSYYQRCTQTGASCVNSPSG